MKKIFSFLGTRPEAIKMAPVVHAFRALAGEGIVHEVCNTGQHREMVNPLLEWFELHPDHSLDLMTHNQSLASFTARALQAIDHLLDHEKPDLVLCQGDTTTAMVVGMAAFYRRIPIGHVEAGLRTHDRSAPFPEEVNRRIIDLVADHCFAPTERAAAELRRESVPPQRVIVTGNTAIDALQWSLRKLANIDVGSLEIPQTLEECVSHPRGRRWALVTAHRRESFGAGMEDIAAALRRLATVFPALQWIYPVHPNPNVQDVMNARLAGIQNVRLVPPLSYPVLCWLLSRSELVLTDSGGLQEECPSLGIPVFVMRQTSERPEGIETGNAQLVGTGTEGIVTAVERFFGDEALQRTMRTPRSVYGDGTAAEQIARYCLRVISAADAPETAH